MRRDFIKLRNFDRTESPRDIEDCYKTVNLYPIKEDTVIPKEALDSENWEIPEGFYAIEVKSLD